ncbi:hypothetical protein [Roseibium sp. RKSG952]|uniref:hypothetical protein n=1 Tax=Roseibium sp. RKSG952 TaxID=2529384 RepID=UPI0018AD1503|nr:hypothetical protein [Roseibium sp. RKSG952]
MLDSGSGKWDVLIVCFVRSAVDQDFFASVRPEPFLLWAQLEDYAINYEINAYTSRGSSLPKILSDLRESIVDVLNENETQIMTPSYIADPREPKISSADWDSELAHISD